MVQSRDSSTPKATSLPKAIGVVLFWALQAIVLGPLLIAAIMTLVNPGADSGLIFAAFWPLVILAVVVLLLDGIWMLIAARKKQGTAKLIHIAIGLALCIPALGYALLNIVYFLGR